MIETPTTLKNLKSLKDAVNSKFPVLVQGEVGCGKSFLIRELAKQLSQDSGLVELHIDDQTDSKALIGAYVCSDIPGEFIWQPGVIAQAVLHGKWVVIENLDTVPLDIIASISSLLERRMLYLPSVESEIVAHPNFRIFGTRIPPQNEIASTTPLFIPCLKHFSYLWQVVHIHSVSSDEMRTIISHKFPSIVPVIVEALIGTFLMSTEMQQSNRPLTAPTVTLAEIENDDSRLPQEGSLPIITDGEVEGEDEFVPLNGFLTTSPNMAKIERSFTLRDVIKTAQRISSHVTFNQTSGFVTEAQRVSSFCEVVDVFLSSIRSEQQCDELCVLLACSHVWQLAQPVVETQVIARLVQVYDANESNIMIGRVQLSLPAISSAAMSTPRRIKSDQFAHTRLGVRLLEKIASGVSAQEAILLVGETGCGKTTVVQELASLLGKKLVVQNLSLSTDSNDLFGGFKPVTMRQLFQPTYELFIELFQQTFSNAQNNEFLQVVAQYFRKSHWKKMLKAFSKAKVSAITRLQQQPTDGSTAVVDLGVCALLYLVCIMCLIMLLTVCVRCGEFLE